MTEILPFPTGQNVCDYDIAINEKYFAKLVFSATNSKLDAYVNTSFVGSETGVGNIYRHNNGIGIAGPKETRPLP